MMHCSVSRLAAVSLLVLSTGCPDDPAEGTTNAGTTNDSSDETTMDPSTITLTTASTTQTTTSETATDPDTTAGPTSITDTDTSETESAGTTDDTTGGSDDSGSGSTGEIMGMPATIPQIQMGDFAEDTPVEVTGAICTAVASVGFFMQDPDGGEWSGIWVYTSANGTIPALGDVVTVVGVYSEFDDLSQIRTTNGGSVTITDSPGEANVPAPEAIAITDAGESYESVFVRISDDTFTVEELSDVAGVNEFRVENGSGDSLWIDDFLYDVVDADELANFGVGAIFDGIQGPLNFTFDEFKIAPRTVEDLSGYVEP
jgi:predicted extracellular nuclease